MCLPSLNLSMSYENQNYSRLGLSSLQPHPLRLPLGGWTAVRSAHISYKFWPSLDLCFFAHFVDKAFLCLRCQSKASHFIRPRSDVTASSKAFPISLPQSALGISLWVLREWWDVICHRQLFPHGMETVFLSPGVSSLRCPAQCV